MKGESDEVNLLDIFIVLFKYRRMILFLTFGGAFIALAVSVISLLLPAEKSLLPNKYTPVAHMLINDSSSSGGALSSLMSTSGLGSLASLAGIDVAEGSTYSALAVYLVGSNEFLDPIVDKFDLIHRYKIKKNPRAKSRQVLMKYLKGEFDEDTGVLSLSFTDIDPEFAQGVVNFAVSSMEDLFGEMGLDKNKRTKDNLEVNLKNSYNEIVRLQHESQLLMSSVNQGRTFANGSSVMLESTRIDLELEAQKTVYTQLKTQYELVKVELASETPVFQVLEYAEVPDRKSEPGRGLLCIIVTFLSFSLSVFLAFVLNAIDNVRKDPEAMAKLKSGSN
jgi:uncharacterized protein involved in exopolysaccharide biosynthesis